MPQNYRSQHPGRSDYQRGGRMRSGADRDRYASGNERRYSADWDEQQAPISGGFEGDRTYAAGGYAEEFGHRRPGSRDLERGQGQRGGDYGSPGDWEREQRQERWSSDDRPWQSQREKHGKYGGGYGEDRRYAHRTGEQERQGPRQRGRGYGEFAPMRWNDDRRDMGEYYGTGSYFGAYGSQPSARSEGMRAYGGGYLGDTQNRWDTPRDDWNERGGSSGSYENYGRSRYGAQSGYGRDYGEPSGTRYGYGQDYHETTGSAGMQGEYRGRGPKGYQRSDERLKEMICERLTDDPRIDASEVTIEVKGKVVKLSGSVQDRRTKYEIEEVVESCGGIDDIQNSIRARSRWGTSTSDTEQSGSSVSERKAGKGSPGSAKRNQ